MEYWPYRGYVRWGRLVTMRNSQRFEDAAFFPGVGFDPKRLLIGDVEGYVVADPRTICQSQFCALAHSHSAEILHQHNVTTWKVKDEKAKNNTKGQRNKGSNEPQGSVFPYFAPLFLCPFVLKKLSSPQLSKSCNVAALTAKKVSRERLYTREFGNFLC